MPYRRILVPVDGSETSNKAIAAAARLAQETGGVLRLFHTIDELAYLSGFEYSADVVGMARTAGEKVLEDGLALAKLSGVQADSRLLELPGLRLGETVAREAADFGADLIVVGTHGRRGFSRALLGSGAEQIIRLAPVPVLVIRGE
ncbi:MAG: universal stress protein [Burkholderiales bacterium]|nr:universal stress protein [Burkholderiales bacterium]